MPILLNIINELEQDINSRELDRYYADSWEQSRQISEDIEEMKKQKEILSNYKNEKYDRKSFLKIIHSIIYFKTIKYRVNTNITF